MLVYGSASYGKKSRSDVLAWELNLGFAATDVASVSPVQKQLFGLVSPQWLTLQEWADAFVHVNVHILILPRLMQESDFNLWASEVTANPAFHGLKLPDPFGVDWREWALQVNLILSVAALQ